MKRIIGPGLAAAAILGATVGTAQAEAKTLRFGVFFSERANVVQKVLIPWAKWFEKESDGTAKVKFFFGGSLGRNPRAQYKLVQGKVMDIAFVVPSYTPGTFPDLSILQAPNMARDAIEGSQSAWRLHEKGLLRGLDKIQVVGIFTTGAYSVHTTVPVKSVADLKGLKLRSGGSVQNEIVKAMGAVPVGMPPTRVAENITRGLLKGSVSEWNAAKTFKILEVTKHHFITSWGVLPLIIAMNKDAYAGLDAKAKAAVAKSGPVMADLQGKASDEATNQAIAKIKADSQQTLTEASDADVAAMNKAFEPILAGIKKRAGDKLWSEYVKILQDIRASRK
ncbi:MAG: TRAP transporter substrate-binding protein DctP [Bauldia litoralis]